MRVINPKIKNIDLLDKRVVIEKIYQGKSLGAIADELHTFKDIIREIALKNGIPISGNIVKSVENPVEILLEPGKKYKIPSFKGKNSDLVHKLFIEGKTQSEIAKAINVSRQYVDQVEKRAGIRRNSFCKSMERKLLKLIKKDIASNFSYDELLERYNVDGDKLNLLERKYGMSSTREYFIKKRNKTIARLYSEGKTALEIINSNNKFLTVGGSKLTADNRIYALAIKYGQARFPQIGNRSAGGCFETYEILRTIEILRDNHGETFDNIAKILNHRKQKTITGTTFSHQNVQVKYEQFKKHKYTIKPNV